MTDEDEDDEIREGKILNPPDVIWLNAGELDWQDVEFSELDEVSWCADKVYKADIRYVLATPLTKAAPDMLEVLRTIVERLEWQWPSDEPDLLAARAAIAKATGGEG